MRRILPVLLLTTAACVAPPQDRYCESQGSPPGSPGYAACVGFYGQQEARFRDDRVSCDMAADQVYPPTLYSQGTWIMGVNPWGRPEMIPVDPDWQHNHALDMLRMSRVIAPCMQAKGWNSGESWTAGRHPAGKPAAHPHPAKPAGRADVAHVAVAIVFVIARRASPDEAIQPVA